MGLVGGIKIEKIKEETREAVDEYYGGLNELEFGVRSMPPQPPDVLTMANAVEKFGTLFNSGGIADQPYIWLIQIWEALAEKTIHERLREREASQNGNPGRASG